MRSCCLLLGLLAGAAALPAGLHSEAEIDRLLAQDPTDYAEMEVPALPHFNIPLGIEFDEDAFENLNFIMTSEKVTGRAAAKTRVRAPDDDGAEPPILCETICRPMNADEKMPRNREGVQPAEQASGPPSQEAENDADPAVPPMMLLDVGKQLCEAKGGNWNHAGAACDPFMKGTQRQLTYDPKGIFNACQEEHGMLYVPCNPYQALALAHMYKVDDHSYYWLWPGGRHDQVHKAALKQDMGNNPTQGLDTCPDEQHIGFFHNWDEAHVDSWGCLHESQNIPVLCCRRG